MTAGYITLTVIMKIVKISTKKPPKWVLNAVKKKWGVLWENGIIFTYDGIISSCLGIMTEDLLAHEGNHIIQQGNDPKEWWEKYLADDEFRYGQELECYQKQYEWISKRITNKSEKFKLLRHYAAALSGGMYGELVNLTKAMSDIQNYDKKNRQNKV